MKDKLLSYLLIMSLSHSLTERLSDAGVIMTSPDYTCSMRSGNCLILRRNSPKRPCSSGSEETIP